MASASSSSPICLHCYHSSKDRVALEEDYDTHELVCPRCARVDSARSSARNLVGESTSQGTLLEEHDILQTFRGTWAQNESLKERRYKYTLEGLLDVYLTDPRTCILENPDPDLKRHALTIFDQIRKAELRKKKKFAEDRQDKRHFKAATNPASRVFPFQVVVAIKLAAQLRTLSWINERLDRDETWEKGAARTQSGITPSSPPLWELYKATHRLPDAASGRLDDYYYLDRILRISCRLIKCPLSRTDDILCLFLQAIRRFKVLASFDSFQARLPHLYSKPMTGEGKNSKEREWRLSDWAYFDSVGEIDWEQVLEVGYNLYLAQQCVGLWDRCAASQCAVALCLHATSGVLREVIPQQINLIRELSLEFGLNDGTASERFRDLKKFIICWSTSLPDIGKPFPQINAPRVGGIGDGFKNYASDLRRGIPENEILVAVMVDVASNWQDLCRSRLRTRDGPRTYAEELKNARVLAAKAGMRLEDSLMSSRLKEAHRSRQFASAMLSAIDHEQQQEEDEEPQSEEETDNEETRYPPTPPRTMSVTRTQSISEPSRPSQSQSPTSRLTPPLHPPMDVEERPALDALLLEPENSSDGEGGSDRWSDDDAYDEDEAGSGQGPSASKRRNKDRQLPKFTGKGLDLSGLGDSSEPFAFTIGPEGFSRAQAGDSDPSSRHVQVANLPSAHDLDARLADKDMDKDKNALSRGISISATSHAMRRVGSTSTAASNSRQRGCGSGTGSASETERAVTRPNGPNASHQPKGLLAVGPEFVPRDRIDIRQLLNSSRASSVISDISKRSAQTIRSAQSAHAVPASTTSTSSSLPLTPGLSVTPLRDIDSQPSESPSFLSSSLIPLPTYNNAPGAHGTGNATGTCSAALPTSATTTTSISAGVPVLHEKSENPDKDSLIGSLERERSYYMTDRSASRADAKKRIAKAKEEAAARGETWRQKKKTAAGPGPGAGAGPAVSRKRKVPAQVDAQATLISSGNEGGVNGNDNRGQEGEEGGGAETSGAVKRARMMDSAVGVGRVEVESGRADEEQGQGQGMLPPMLAPAAAPAATTAPFV